MSFGSKLNSLPVVPPKGETTATLTFIPRDETFKQDVTIFVEMSAGIGTLKITVRSPPRESES